MASPKLPSDIVTNILSRLPSKPLIRFKSVSKQWYSLINSPIFINLHLTQTLIFQNSPNLILSHFTISSVPISDDSNPNFHFIKLDHPLQHLCKTDGFSTYERKFAPIILGSVNGVVCMSMYDKSSVVLYNPSTKTHRFVPPFISSPNSNPLFEISPDGTVFNFVVFGFGFDSVSGDYKVLRMIERCNDYGLLHGETSVYSLKNDSWKSVNDPKKGLVIQNSMGAFVNDVLHFIVIDDYLKPKVKCFNLQTEKFSFLDLPKFDDKFSRNCYVIRELGGCLSMMVNYQNVYLGSVGDRTLGKADLWVMKEYGNKESWFRLFSIRDPAKLDVLTHLRPVVYSRDKERVLLELDNMSYGWYSWGSKYFESIIVHGGPFAFAPYETWTFVDSLVSIGKVVSVGKDKDKDASKAKIVPKKIKNKVNKDDFLSSGFKLKL